MLVGYRIGFAQLQKQALVGRGPDMEKVNLPGDFVGPIFYFHLGSVRDEINVPQL